MLRQAVAFAVAVLFVPVVWGQDRFRPFLQPIPNDINLLVVADVRAIYASPLATSQKWSTEQPLAGFSPILHMVALGSKLDHATFQEDWQVGVAYLSVNISMDELAKREGGARESLVGAEAVLSPRNAYFVSMQPFQIGMVYPANRQDAAKWVRYSRNSPRAAFAPSLMAAVGTVTPSTQFMLALDLADTVTAETVRPRIAKSAALKGRDLDAAAKVLSSIQGLRLDLNVTDAITGTLHVSFGEDVAPIAPAARALLQEILARRGASFDDLETWTAEAAGTSVTFRGPMKEAGYRQLLSLLTPPAPNLADGEVESNNPLAGEIRLQASKRYFQTIQRQLDALKTPPSRTRRSYEDFALWYEKAADSISRLPVANVDPDLRKFGYDAVDHLKAIAASARGEQVQVNKASDSFRFSITQSSGWGGGWRGRGGWGGGGTFLDTNMADVEQAKQTAFQQGTQMRDDIWNNLLAITDKVRKAMYDKFKTPF